MNWYYLKEKAFSLPDEEVNEDSYFRSCFDFDSGVRAAGYSKNYDNEEGARYLFCEKDNISPKNFDFKNGVIVLGTQRFDMSDIFDEDEDEDSFECITWLLCHSQTDIDKFLKEENILTTKPILYFNMKSDHLEEEILEYDRLCLKAEAKRMRTIHVEGDIIITDPCYIMRKDSKHNDDWDKCDCGKNMEVFGFTDYLTHSTLYGDWSCTTFNSDTKEVIGEFCADAGMVSVFLLEDVLRYNPEFDYHINKPWTTTLIKDFKGDIAFKKLNEETIIVKGVGNINFETRQTGF